ncbi:MAG: lamin tail domain-containing protein, partial [Candidatus Latescibacteria bacterium]|nr:lamin tail domain-containing protein [Candidatus Latescibacterota bacterium]
TVLPRPRIVINEVLCDPPSDGDANRDGAVDPYQDEFIELLNVGLDSVDIGNWRLSDDDVSSASQFVFPPGTHVAPGEYVVLFGGGAPAGFAGQVFVDDGRIGNGLTNRGDVIRLIAPDGPDTIAVLTYSDWGSDQSFVRWPEGLGDFVPHAPLPGKGRFSPGTVRTVLVSITVTPEDATIVLGKELSFSARGIFSDGSTQDLTSDVRWSTSDSTVALVHSPGRIVPVSAGGTQIRATFGAVGSLSQTLTVVWPPPVADFSASPTEGLDTLTVAFTDQSAGLIHRVLWDFGDGSPADTPADTTRNPVHTYSTGTFTVRLTVTGPGGTDTETKTDLITVLPKPEEPPPEEPLPPLPVNLPPVVADIPDQIIAYGERFVPFDLNDYVSDAETPDAGIRWTCSGQGHVSVEIGDDHIVRLRTVPADWIGSEVITFSATDAGGLSASDSMRATIRAPETLKGDVNGDGLVDTTDVARMADFILGYIPLDAHQRTA